MNLSAIHLVGVGLVAGWAAAPWLPWPAPFVVAGAAGWRLIVDRPAIGMGLAVLAAASQLAWIPDAWRMAGRSQTWLVFLGLTAWQSTALLVTVGLAAIVHRRISGWMACALSWAVGQAVADLWVPLPALHATLIDEPTLLWPAAVLGPVGVTLVVAAIGALLVEAPRRGIAAAVVWIAIGLILPTMPMGGRPVPAAVIQPDLHAMDATPSRAQARQDQLVTLIADARDAGAQLIALPEGAWPHDPGANAGSRRRDFLEAIGPGATVVTGANVGSNTLPTNSLVSAPQWRRLDKVALVPGWERARLGFGRDRYQPGAGPALLELPELTIGGLICVEDVVPNRIQRAGTAEVLIAATNDSWNGPGAGSKLHLAHSRLAAVSTGLWVLRPAMNGPSAILDPWGRSHWSAPWVDHGPGRLGIAMISVGRSWRTGRFGLLWDALAVLGLVALWWRRLRELTP